MFVFVLFCFCFFCFCFFGWGGGWGVDLCVFIKYNANVFFSNTEHTKWWWNCHGDWLYPRVFPVLPCPVAVWSQPVLDSAGWRVRHIDCWGNENGTVNSTSSEYFLRNIQPFQNSLCFVIFCYWSVLAVSVGVTPLVLRQATLKDMVMSNIIPQITENMTKTKRITIKSYVFICMTSYIYHKYTHGVLLFYYFIKCWRILVIQFTMFFRADLLSYIWQFVFRSLNMS